MRDDNVQRMFAYVEANYPPFIHGIKESMSQNPRRFKYITELFLSWAIKARGENAIESSIDAFVQFTTDVNFAQARYEREGAYENKSFQEVYDSHYSQNSQMKNYLWGVYLTNFLWAHHLELSLFFEDRFLPKLSKAPAIIEIAPGHGGWGVWALTKLPGATLNGFDISPSSIQIASSLSVAAGVDNRTAYFEKDALELENLGVAGCNALICSFLVEHLEEPSKLFSVIQHLLKPGGVAFVTGVLTAAQVDHIFEIKKESEMLLMAESKGLRVLESLSANPKKQFPRARFVPRSMALLIEKPKQLA